MNIVLSLPHALTSLFVVVAERIPFDVTAVPWRVGAPHRRAAIRAIGSPALLVTHQPTRWRPGRTSLTADERRLLRRSGEHLVVSTTVPPHELPGGVQLARATARALARAYDGLLIDPLSGMAVPACERAEGEPVDFDLGDDWLGWDIHPHDTTRLRPASSVGPPPGSPPAALSLSAVTPAWSPRALGLSPRAPEPGVRDGLGVTSRGLRRFAVPEITLDGGACTHHRCAIGLLRTVAHRLVTDQLAFVAAHPDIRQRAIDDHLRIEPLRPGEPPFAVRLTPCETGSPEPGRAGGTTRLKVAPAGGTDQATCLRAGPPPGFPDTFDARPHASPGATLTAIDGHTSDPSRALAA
ncbi:hypothetical protein ACTMTF_13435 [Nonomuraea sp. ZG12]|uniref:hypothetical protein n=1 Tax=Nonomuraea sp. ZG12 TaxID=3452207 RepID=UPI003F8A2C67